MKRTESIQVVSITCLFLICHINSVIDILYVKRPKLINIVQILCNFSCQCFELECAETRPIITVSLGRLTKVIIVLLHLCIILTTMIITMDKIHVSQLNRQSLKGLLCMFIARMDECKKCAREYACSLCFCCYCYNNGLFVVEICLNFAVDPMELR